jgi:hypothetical protein
VMNRFANPSRVPRRPGFAGRTHRGEVARDLSGTASGRTHGRRDFVGLLFRRGAELDASHGPPTFKRRIYSWGAPAAGERRRRPAGEANPEPGRVLTRATPQSHLPRV